MEPADWWLLAGGIAAGLVLGIGICSIFLVRLRHRLVESESRHAARADIETEREQMLTLAAEQLHRSFGQLAQQAQAVVAARTKIVEGAVGMVEMALSELGDRDLANFDEDRKATMISNLLVVLCSEHAAQPVVNTGTLYQ